MKQLWFYVRRWWARMNGLWCDTHQCFMAQVQLPLHVSQVLGYRSPFMPDDYTCAQCEEDSILAAGVLLR